MKRRKKAIMAALMSAVVIIGTAASVPAFQNDPVDYDMDAPDVDSILEGMDQNASFDDSADYNTSGLDQPEADSISDEPDQNLTFDDSADYTISGPDFRRSYEEIRLAGSRLFTGGQSRIIPLGNPTELMISGGFIAVDMDMNTELGSRELSRPFEMQCGDAVVTIQVINPYEKSAPLNECFVACAYCESSGVSHGFAADEYAIGDAVKDDLLPELVASAYRDEDGELLIKTVSSPILRSYASVDPPYGKQVLDDTERNMDLTYLFDEGGVLCGISMVAPGYLYNGLEDNIEEDEIGDLDNAQLLSAASLRDDILGQLAAAFEEAGVHVEIDQQKGTITMASEVLFEVGDATLSDEGKIYLNAFIEVYTTVLLGDEFKDDIRAIEIEGHTDPNGTYEYNLDLSENRANSVYEFCSEQSVLDDGQKAVFSEKAEKRGYSFSDPVFTDDGEIDYDRSRRVEMKFMLNIGE